MHNFRVSGFIVLDGIFMRCVHHLLEVIQYVCIAFFDAHYPLIHNADELKRHDHDHDRDIEHAYV